MTITCTFVLTLAFAVALPGQAASPASQRDETMDNKITIRIGDKAFAATLANNATAAAFKKLLPLSVTMAELNANEKFTELSVSVPTRPSRPPTIQAGDLMMYGSKTLVLFYKSFRTTYSYSNIGRVEDPAGLEAALGAGSVLVTFDARKP